MALEVTEVDPSLAVGGVPQLRPVEDGPKLLSIRGEGGHVTTGVVDGPGRPSAVERTQPL